MSRAIVGLFGSGMVPSMPRRRSAKPKKYSMGGRRLMAAMVEYGYTDKAGNPDAKELGKKLGLGYSTVIQWMNGGSQPRPVDMRRILGLMKHITADWLYFGWDSHILPGVMIRLEAHLMGLPPAVGEEPTAPDHPERPNPPTRKPTGKPSRALSHHRGVLRKPASGS